MAKKKAKAEVCIGGNNYQLIFGFRFLNEIKALPGTAGAEEDNSLTMLIAGLIDGDPEWLKYALCAALVTYDELGEKDIIEYLETSEEVADLFDNFLNFLTSAPLLKKRTTKITETLQELQVTMDKATELEMEKAMSELSSTVSVSSQE